MRTVFEWKMLITLLPEIKFVIKEKYDRIGVFSRKSGFHAILGCLPVFLAITRSLFENI